MTTSLLPPRPASPQPNPPPKHRRDRRLVPNRDTLLFGALLVAAAALYLWDLTASGYANTFYAAAVQAGSKDWTASTQQSLTPTMLSISASRSIVSLPRLTPVR